MIKRSAAVLVKRGTRGGERVLLTLRPETDAELPGVWGLPACSLEPNETWREAALRCGLTKLGVQLRNLEPAGEAPQTRETYRLRMRLFAARAAPGKEPSVPQPNGPKTQYASLRWEPPVEALRILEKGASLGSLCCELAAQHLKSLEVRG